MRTLAAPLLVLCLSAPPLAAQDDAPGRSLIEDGARMLLEGLLREMEPALKELEGFAQEVEPSLRSFAEEMGPALRNLMGQVQDWSAYHPPEMLPNGDIILRRKEPTEPAPDVPRGTGPEIEL